MNSQRKGPAATWDPAEVAALYRLCLDDPAGNARISVALVREGDGKWPTRPVATIANIKTHWFGFSVDYGAIDFSRAKSPPRPDNPFWALIGKTPVVRKRKNKAKPRPTAPDRQDAPVGAHYSRSVRIEACKSYMSGTPSRDVAESLGMKDASALLRWMKNERFNPGLQMPDHTRAGVRNALALASPPPPTATEAVAESTTNGAPITHVTIDDGHDIKMTFPIREHAATVISKLMELSKQ